MKQKSPDFDARWIWCDALDSFGYNQAACFRKSFQAPASTKKAFLHITADSRYRVSINGRWINDGPGKAYPEHWLLDSYDIAEFLKPGTNRVDVVVRHYGVGTFHQIPQQAGLLALLELDKTRMGTDSSWLAAPFAPLRRWTPKVSPQMEPVEEFDARLDRTPAWKPAVELFHAKDGPWKDLRPRATREMSKVPCRFSGFLGASILKREPGQVCVPVTRIAHPGLIEANKRTGRPVILASMLDVKKSAIVNSSSPFWRVAIDGKFVGRGGRSLDAGRYLVVFFLDEFYGHWKERIFPFLHIPGARWRHPWNTAAEHPWFLAVLDDFLYHGTDMIWDCFPDAPADEARAGYEKAVRTLGRKIKDVPSLRAALATRERPLPIEQIFLGDFSADFEARQPVGQACHLVESPGGAIGNGKTRVHPSRKYDVELCYDLGEQRCGYLTLDVEAPEGTVIDLHLVEYITPEGVIQHTTEFNRNGMRFIAAAGRNRHISFKRRSGRFLFVIFRKLTNTAVVRKIGMIESTASVRPVARFKSSEPMLDRIWEISERTLKMGTEDVFTDCSLYEQTLWIGDARNEARYAAHVYGAGEVSARSIELGAQSLERFPIVGCQVPSGWECLLPAWSFLWGMHTWEHYFSTGDRVFLRKIWPSILRNIQGSLALINKDGLFSAPFWNLFEWAPIDHDHETVMHNSMLLAGALRAAGRCAEVLGDVSSGRRLAAQRRNLIRAINRCWDKKAGSYPDAFLADGTPSRKTCQHTSILAVVCGVAPREHLPAIVRNIVDPPSGMTRINSPFAAQFLYEALMELDRPEEIIPFIRENYGPMIEAGATTVWETFPGSTCSPPGFPTRSHCHGWSCAPLEFFNTVILGIRQTSPGGRSFTISPNLCDLEWASGAVSTPPGPVHVQWSVRNGALDIRVVAPKCVKISFRKNPSLRCLKIRFQVEGGRGRMD